MKMLNRIKSVSAIPLTIFAMNSAALDAPAGLVPAGLSPGDTFFVIYASDNLVNGAQTSATYIGYAATSATSGSKTNTIAGWTTLFAHDDGTITTTSAFGGVTNRPIYNTVGTKVADDRADLFDNTLDAAIGFDEDGDAVAASIWTGFFHDGSALNVGDDTLGGADGVNDGCATGSSSSATGAWALNALSGGAGCAGATFGLYVLSPLLTVPTPIVGSSSPQSW